MWKYSRVLFLILIITSALFSQNDNVATYSKKVYYDKDSNTTKISGDVIVNSYKRNVSITADSMTSNNENISINDNVFLKNKDTFIFADKITKQKDGTEVYKNMNLINPSFWVETNNGCKKDDEVNLKKSTISGCNRENPTWKIDFTSGSINTDSKWMSIYNAVFYIYDIPIFYTPYFIYPLNNTRQTGLLVPLVNISSSEGFTYKQTYFIAPKKNWDISVTPEIRSKRGGGGNLELNYAVTPNNIAYIRSYAFDNRESYVNDEKLKNKTTGMSSAYLSADNLIFTKNKNYSDSIYVNLNKIYNYDYYDVSPYNEDNTDKIESDIDFSISDKENVLYSGSNYFNSLSDRKYISNLPSTEYTSYFKKLFNGFITSKKINYNRLQYNETSANELNAKLMSKYTINTLKNYLTLSLNTNVTFNDVNFGNDVTNKDLYENGDEFYINNEAKVGSNLVYIGKKFNHVLNPYISIDMRGNIDKNGYYNNIHKTDIKCDDSFCNALENDYLENGGKIGFTQSLIGKNSRNKFSAVEMFYIFYSYDDNKLSKTFHNLQIAYNKFRLNDKLIYDNISNSVQTNKASISYTNRFLSASISDYYEGNTKTTDKSSSIHSRISLNFVKDITLYSNFNYDLLIKKINDTTIGVIISVSKCLSYNIYYKRELLADGDSDYRDSISFMINLIPLGAPTYEQVIKGN